MNRLIWIAIAGGLGALSRYGLSVLIESFSIKPFPWGTVVVNVVGCFIFGVLWSFFDVRMHEANPEVRVAILVGFMGAFTTFSTYMFETSELIRESQWLSAFGNIAGQNLIGFGVLILGLSVGRFF